MQTWFEKLKADFVLNFVQANRWKYLLDGLGKTLLITLVACLLGVVIGVVIAMVRSTYDKTAEGARKTFGRRMFGVLDGVCVTGGEPTLDPDLERFVTKIKELGYLVKLDTNGYRPEILKKLVEEKKIDYVAMDIKNAPSRYGETAGVKKIDVMRINESVEFLKSGVVDYEFRTTLCKELHGREEIEAIGKWLSGAKRYFLQNYRESDYVIDPRFSGYAREQLEQFCEILRGKIETVEIRGVD